MEHKFGNIQEFAVHEQSQSAGKQLQCRAKERKCVCKLLGLQLQLLYTEQVQLRDCNVWHSLNSSSATLNILNIASQVNIGGD